MRERERERESRVLSGSGGSACVVTETMREPSERTFLYSHGLPRDLFAISRFPGGRPRAPRSYVGMWSALLERSGRAADVRGQRRGPAWRRAPGVGPPRAHSWRLAGAASVSSSPILLPILRLAQAFLPREKKTLKNGGSILIYLSTTCPSYEHGHGHVCGTVISSVKLAIL
jgi:hypothetical protein